MGGINHQPCGKFLFNSTMLSRWLSYARLKFELANVRLEDILLAELSGGIGSVVPIVDQLEASLKDLSGAIHGISALRKQMATENYTDLPTLKTIDLASVGADLASRGCVNSVAWSNVANIMKGKGFFGVLDYFEGKVQNLIKKTNALRDGIKNLQKVAEKGEVNRVLEENKQGNIKGSRLAVG